MVFHSTQGDGPSSPASSVVAGAAANNRAGLYRTPISGGVQSATSSHGLPHPAIAVRNLIEQASIVFLCPVRRSNSKTMLCCERLLWVGFIKHGRSLLKSLSMWMQASRMNFSKQDLVVVACLEYSLRLPLNFISAVLYCDDLFHHAGCIWVSSAVLARLVMHISALSCRACITGDVGILLVRSWNLPLILRDVRRY